MFLPNTLHYTHINQQVNQHSSGQSPLCIQNNTYSSSSPQEVNEPKIINKEPSLLESMRNMSVPSPVRSPCSSATPFSGRKMCDMEYSVVDRDENKVAASFDIKSLLKLIKVRCDHYHHHHHHHVFTHLSLYSYIGYRDEIPF
jgi:hypothetical protein